MTQTSDVREQPAEQSPDYQRLARKHEELSRRLNEFQALRHPSQAERLEAIKLKKAKLAVKDRMEALIGQEIG